MGSMSNKVYFVQVLRGIAAISVVFVHVFLKLDIDLNKYPIFKVLINSGVDIFFIISGFIMLLISEKKTNRVSLNYFSVLINFIANRFLRVIPLYWLFTTLTLVVFLFYPKLVNTSGGVTGIWQSYLLIPIPSNTKFLIQNGWTLTYEIFFYFCFSFFILKNNLIKSFGVLMIFVLFDFFFSRFLNGDNFILMSIKYEFILGFSIYFFFIKKYFLFLFLFILSCFIVYMKVGLDVRFFQQGLLAFLFIFIFSIFEIFLKNNSRVISPLIFLGDISYSLYLTHPFVLQGVNFAFKKLSLFINGALYAIVCMVLSLIFAYMSYIFIEKKFLFLSKSKGGGKIVV